MNNSLDLSLKTERQKEAERDAAWRLLMCVKNRTGKFDPKECGRILKVVSVEMGRKKPST